MMTAVIFLTVLMGFVVTTTIVLAVSSIKLWTEFKAMKMSTHQIQYVDPFKQEFEKVSDDMREKFTKDPFENIA